MDSVWDKVKRNVQSGNLLSAASKAIRNRIVKKVKHLDVWHHFNAEMKATKQFQASFPKINAHHIAMGNYYLDKRIKLDQTSIVYSLGILTDISFDQAVSERFNCPIYMYDPTPKSIQFMEQHKDNDLYRFHPLGVWTENAILEFTFPEHGGSASTMLTAGGNSFNAACKTMEYIMATNKHCHIDVFKADIEGAALPILEQMLSQGIYPNQIVVEFERPQKDMLAVQNFIRRVQMIRETLEEKDYESFLLPRKSEQYFSLELLFAKID